MFPGWLNSLPKSGGWLNTVKVVLGFLELALFQILVKCGLSATIAFAGRDVLAIWIAILEH
jgi:thiol:disulfide interchange protein DsbD